VKPTRLGSTHAVTTGIRGTVRRVGGLSVITRSLQMPAALVLSWKEAFVSVVESGWLKEPGGRARRKEGGEQQPSAARVLQPSTV